MTLSYGPKDWDVTEKLKYTGTMAFNLMFDYGNLKPFIDAIEKCPGKDLRIGSNGTVDNDGLVLIVDEPFFFLILPWTP
jgi:hypothetical protein